MKQEKRNKVLLIGIDGASWNIITPMIKKGKLPNLEKMIVKGSSCILESVEPLLSPSIWTTIATGKKPDKHGIKDFFVTSEEIRSKRVWDMAEESGLSIGIYDYMVTWPPRPVNGFMIPGPFSYGSRTFPEEYGFIRKLAMEEKNNNSPGIYTYLNYGIKGLKCGINISSLLSAMIYLVRNRMKRYESLEKFYIQRMIKDKLYSDLFIGLLKRYSPDFAVYSTNLTDAVQHSFWKYYEHEKFEPIPDKDLSLYKDVIPQAYIQIDKNIGRITSMNDDSTVIIVSDHGFQAETDGYLNHSTRKYINYTIKIGRLIEELFLSGQVRYFNLGRTSFIKVITMDETHTKGIMNELKKITAVDSNTMSHNLFAINLDSYKNITVKINSSLEKFDKLEKMDVVINNKVISFNEIIDITNRFSGDHDKNGILIASGKNIRRGMKINKSTVSDITPTILTLLNLPVGKDMDGKVISEAIDENFLDSNPIRYIDSWEEENNLPKNEWKENIGRDDERIKEQLADLGYL